MGKSSGRWLRTLVACLALAAIAAIAIAVAAGGGSSPVHTATVEAAAGGDGASAGRRRVVWAVGDGADGGSAARSVAAMIKAARPDRFLYLGDVYESGTWEEFRRNYETTFGRLKRITLPTPGNHEWPNHAAGYDRYWSGRGLTRRGDDAYARKLAGWQLISLNSEAPHARGSRQWRWLRRKLGGGGNCRIAFWHRPRFSAGSHGSQPDMAPVWRLLRRRAKLVLAGHEHNMQRLGPSGGITTLIAGSGGHGHYAVAESYPSLDFADTGRYGALRLLLRRGSARWRFVSVDGAVLDRGRTRCRPPRRSAAG